MNYSADRPINKSEEDLLGRASFSKYLGKAIYEYNGSDGLVIGLFGKWGTGKTSIINMAIEEIEKRPKNNENKPIIMDFSPWNYSDKNDLISLFFQSLKSKFDLEKNEKLENDIGTALSNYAEAFELLSIVPMFGSGLAKLLKIIAKSEGNNLMKIPDLDSTKKKLEEKFKKSKQKIIIVIDDIDRLTNPQIRDIFQLVKQVANFPNIIYILSMDRDVVSRALEEVHNIDGNQYLEKIIQLPFEIPELRKHKINDIFLLKLDKIIKELPYNVIWGEDYWGNIFRNCIEPYIKTLRDVNRVINTFSFRYGMLYEETCFEDMVAITTIEVLEPKLYKWICNNKFSLCGGLEHKQLTGINEEEYRKQCTDEFTRINIDSERAIKYISTLFPEFSRDVGKPIDSLYSYSDIRVKMRVAHEDKFDLYFAPDLDDIKVPISIINGFIYNFDSDKIKEIIGEINEKGNMDYFIESIFSLINKIPYNRLCTIASSMLIAQGEFNDINNPKPLTLSPHDMVESCSYNIIRKLETDRERFNIIKNTVEDINKYGLGMIALTIIKIENSYGRLMGFENKENQIIKIEQLKQIEESYVRRIKEVLTSESILEINRFSNAFDLWKLLDEEGSNKYIKDIFKDNLQKLRFICSIAGRWDGTEGNGWSFYLEEYVDYIYDEEIYNLIQRFAKKNLDKFSELELIKLATFVLNYEKYDMKHGSNEEQAAKLVEEWKQSQ